MIQARPLLDLHLLRTFCAVAETASMTRAAQLLNMSQGAVSQQIRKLEEQLASPLLDRQKTGLTLTDAGEVMLSKARQLLVLNDRIMRDVTPVQFAGTLSLGIPLDLMGGRLPNILRLFAEQYPDVGINLVCAGTLELKAALANGELDLSLLEEQDKDRSGRSLFTDQLVWIGARGGTVRARNPLALSIASTGCVFRLPAMEALDRIARPWKRVYESNNLDALFAMIRMDLAVGVFLSSLVPPELEKIPFGDAFPKLPKFHVTLAQKAGARNEMAAALADFIESGYSK